MSLGDDQKPTHGVNFILGRIVACLWQGHDQFVVFDAEMIRAYGDPDPSSLLQELGEGWSAVRQDVWGETILTRIIPASTALKQLGF